MNVTRRGFLFGTLFAPLLKFFPSASVDYRSVTAGRDYSQMLAESELVGTQVSSMSQLTTFDYGVMCERFRESARWTERVLREQILAYADATPSSAASTHRARC